MDAQATAPMTRRAGVLAHVSSLPGPADSGDFGAASLAADDRLHARTRRGGTLARLFLIGDLLDLGSGTLTSLVRPGRWVSALQILAPHELLADDDLQRADVEWVDLESGEPGPTS